MRTSLSLMLLLAVVPAAAVSAAPAGPVTPPSELAFQSTRFGKVSVYPPAGPPKGIALFLSGDGGWNLGVIDMARSLAAQGVVVAGVSTPAYLRTLEAGPEACIDPNRDLRLFADDVAIKAGLNRVARPVLVGYSSGATLAYAALAQAPAGQYLGGVSLGFGPDLPGQKPWCAAGGLAATRISRPEAGWLFEPARLSVPWIVLQGLKDQVVSASDTRAFVTRVPGARLIELPLVGHGFAVERNWMPQFRTAFVSLFPAPPAQAASSLGRMR